MAQTMDITDPTVRTMTEYETHFSVAKSYCDGWHEDIAKWRRWYNFDHYVGRGRALPYEERYADPTPTNVCDLAIGILVKKPLEWKAQGWEPDLVEEEDSSRIEKYLSGTLYVNMEREELNIPYEIVTHIVRDGTAVIYSVWDPVLGDAVLEETEAGQVFTETPLRLQVIDPVQIYVIPGGPKRWGHMFREWEMSIHDVETTYDVTLHQHTHVLPRDKMVTKVRVKDYWRIQRKGKEIIVENALIADEQVIRPLRVMEGYDDLPYTIGHFKPTARDDPRGWHGILKPIESTITHLEDAVNRRGRQIRIYTSLPFVARTIPNRRIRLDPALGNMVHLNLEESLEFPTWPGNAPDVEHHVSFLRSRLQQAGFTDVMFGEGPGQVSGYALSQLGDQNQIRLAQPVQHLEMMWSAWARKALRLTSYFTGDGQASIRVYGRLRGQDFAQQLQANDLAHYMVKARIQPVYPNEDTRKHAMGTQTADILSDHTRMERYYDIDQPDDERDRRMDEQTMKHPLFVQCEVLQRLLRMSQPDEGGMSDEDVRMTAAQMALSQMQSGMMGPQGGGTGAGLKGRPEEPRAPEQMMGVASPTGMPTRQEQGGAPAGQDITDVLRQLTEAAPGFTPGGGSI